MYPHNTCTMETRSHTMRYEVASKGKVSCASHITSNGKSQRENLIDQNSAKDSSWMLDSSSQAYSGAEDTSTDPHETLTETSTLTFVDAHTINESEGSPSFRGMMAGGGASGLVYIKEFVLIDDDDDEDMSLREKTVTDVSMSMDGKAADLVCGRLFTTSSGSLTDFKDETPVPAEAPPTEEAGATPGKEEHCCFCTIL